MAVEPDVSMCSQTYLPWEANDIVGLCNEENHLEEVEDSGDGDDCSIDLAFGITFDILDDCEIEQVENS